MCLYNKVFEYSSQHYEVSIFNAIIPCGSWGSRNMKRLMGEWICPKSPPWKSWDRLVPRPERNSDVLYLIPSLEYIAVSSVLWIKKQINMSIRRKLFCLWISVWIEHTSLLNAWKTMGCHVSMHTSQRTVPGPNEHLNMCFLWPTLVEHPHYYGK